MAKRKPMSHGAEANSPMPWQMMVGLVEQLLLLMGLVIAGKVEMEDVRYARAFGSKEGLVPQLQRLCAVLKDVQALSGQSEVASGAAAEPIAVDEDEEALISYYLNAVRAQKTANADAVE